MTKKLWMLAAFIAGVILFHAQISLAQQQQQRPLVPDAAALSEAASKAVTAEWLTPEERSAMRVFHGVWDERDLSTPTLRALAALTTWRLDDPSLDDPAVSVELRAEARLWRGDLEEAIDLLKGAQGLTAARIRAEAFEALGRSREAEDAVAEPARQLITRRTQNAEELTEGVRALLIRARVQGQPSRDFQTMMQLLARAHQELDRLYWPAKMAEASLLLDKDNTQDAVAALHEALELNPRSSEVWYALGRVALDLFDFPSAQQAAISLRRLNRHHPLADLLEAEASLIQNDPEAAAPPLLRVLNRWPKMRFALALKAAMEAIRYDEASLRAALDAYDALSPGHPQAYFVVGRQLSFNRQYGIAAEMLEEAIRRQPNWPAPQIELGLLELQSGRDDRALAALKRVAELDRYNKRAANSLFLLEELATYETIESEHFIVRYKPGIDRVLAELMPDVLEKIHATVAGRFEHEPDRKTVIEVLPDHQRFAVRITGMPFIHTIAACTGPVIAMEVPREGPPSKHLGLFDWPRVIQHEYTHTITLSQTRNRIPMWVTEAAAVSMEFAPRDYNTVQMLARAQQTGTLFNLDEINWAFVRPKKPNDRAMAYAQGHWMVQYMNERWGQSALVRLLERYHAGVREQQAIPDALGVSREQFFADFLVWAAKQVESWGLAARPSLQSLTDQIRLQDKDLAVVMLASQQARLDAIAETLAEQIGRPSRGVRRTLVGSDWPDLVRPPVAIPDETLDAWLDQYPDHPDVVELHVRRLLRFGEPDESVLEQLKRYSNLRPADPFPLKRLVQASLASNDPTQAIEYLERLDAVEDKTAVYALELARLYRQKGDLDNALGKALRAVHINAYHAATRELAAAIAIEAGKLAVARQHIAALTILEPDRPQHKKRLEAIDRLIQEN